jgi:hypothetical protein
MKKVASHRNCSYGGPMILPTNGLHFLNLLVKEPVVRPKGLHGPLSRVGTWPKGLTDAWPAVSGWSLAERSDRCMARCLGRKV